MEESITVVEPESKNPAEILPSVPVPQPPVSTFTTVDNNLTRIGYFTASSKRSRKEIEKTTTVMDHGVVRKISIIPTAKYGLPITQDQDYWLALMKLVSEHVQSVGNLVNPFKFTTAEILRILGLQRHNGKNYKAVQEWLSVMKHTGIEGGAYNVAKKKWATDRVSAVDRVTTLGEQFSDGTVADKNYIWFSQWQLDNINAGHLVAVELGTYIQLENNISRNLVPHLQEWLFASQHDGRFEKQYEDVCQLLGIRIYRYRSQIEEKLGPSLNELVKHGYLASWAIEPMADRKHYKLVLWHGPKYHTDRQARINKKPRTENLGAGETTPARRPRQRSLHLHPSLESSQPSVVIDYQTVAELEKRGIGTTDARQLLAGLPPEQIKTVPDQLEHADQLIEAANRSRKPIQNPQGFYIDHLRRNVPLPPGFESTRARIARQKAESEQAEAIRQQQMAAMETEELERATLNSQIDSLSPEDRFALMNQAKADLMTRHPRPEWLEHHFKTHPESETESGFLRSRAQALLKEGWQPKTTQTGNPHQAINQPTHQATPLQELVPSTLSAAAPSEQGTILQIVADQPQLAPALTKSEQPSVPTLSDLKALLDVLMLPAPAEMLASMKQAINDSAALAPATALVEETSSIDPEEP